MSAPDRDAVQVKLQLVFPKPPYTLPKEISRCVTPVETKRCLLAVVGIGG